MIYTTRLDFAAKVTTIALSALLVAIAYIIVSAIPEDATFGLRLLLSCLAFGLLFIIPACYLFSPFAYELTDNALVIKRRRSPVIIPYTEILGVDYINKAFVEDFARAGGNGGLFGYYGDFTSGGKSTYTLYVRHMGKLMLVRVRDGRKLIISPDDHTLIKKLREKIQTAAK